MHTWIELPNYLFKDFTMRVNVDETVLESGAVDITVEFIPGIEVHLKDHVQEWLDHESVVVDYRRSESLIEVGFPDVNTAMRFKLKWSIRE